jgi:hypothetical protein
MKNMSILLNGIDIKKISSYGSYGYGYGYGHKYGYGYGYAGYGYSYTQEKKKSWFRRIIGF